MTDTTTLGSVVCRHEHFLTDWYNHWIARIEGAPVMLDAPAKFHRKPWESAAICQALHERGQLAQGKRGLGFAVGREPLSSLFAALGIDVLATDQPGGEGASAWAASGAHAASLEALFLPRTVDRAAFDRHVRFQPADMRRLDHAALGRPDFIWSACSFEHLGTLKAGLDFVVDSARLLKPGGVAVHTTEFNVSSDEATVAEGGAVIYRARDIRVLDHRLRAIGCGLEAVDFFAGTHPYDLEFDAPPFSTRGRPHIKLLLDGFVATSILLIIRKGEAPVAEGLMPSIEPDEQRNDSQRLRAELDAVYRSTSWRITAPLRTLGRAMARIGKPS